jgi:hypothetical protein
LSLKTPPPPPFNTVLYTMKGTAAQVGAWQKAVLLHRI